jgi:hypothetical protein
MIYDIPGQLKNLLPGNIDAIRGPYPTVEAACAAILNVVIDGHNYREGKIVDIGVEPNTVSYRWIGGFENVNLTPIFGNLTNNTDFKPVKDYTVFISELLQYISDYGLTFTDFIGYITGKIGTDGIFSFYEAYFKILTADNLTSTSIISSLIKVGNVRFEVVTGYDFIISDDLGFIIFDVNQQTSSTPTTPVIPDEITLKKLTIGNTVFQEIAGYNQITTDASGFIGYDIDQTAQVITPVSSGLVFGYPNIIADYGITINAGQSNSLGIDAARFTYPTILPDAYKLDGYGYFEDTANQSLTVLEPLSEDGTFESPSFGMASMEMQALLIENSFVPSTNDYRKIMVVPGVGGTSIQNLMRGTASWTKMLNQVQGIKNIANAAGKTCKVELYSWTHGESNITNTAAEYKALLIQLSSDMNADLSAITGQTELIKVVFYQLSIYSGVNIQQAFFELFQEMPDRFFLSGPTYQYAWHTENLGAHFLNGQESFKYGLTSGYVNKRVSKDNFAWKPLYPVKFTYQSNVIEIDFFVPEGKLVLDTTVVTDPGNYGFNVFNASGTAVGITSVAIARPNTIRLICSGNITAGFKVSYASKNGTVDTNGRTTGSRGCLRDQQGDRVKYTFSTLTFQAHNYCTIFTRTL